MATSRVEIDPDFQEGTITAVYLSRGFGFIKVGSGKDVFFHVTRVQGMEWDGSLIQRDVLVEVIAGERGPVAKRVRPAR